MTTPTLFDWNWFFSSFSQCAAALIAIIGAFVISNLLGLKEKINNVISNFDKLLIEYGSLKERITNRNIFNYVENFVRYHPQIKNDIEQGLYDNDVREAKIFDTEVFEEICRKNPKLYKVKGAILLAFHELFGKHKSILRDLQNSSIRDSFNPLNVEPDWMKGWLSTEKELINQLEIEAKTLIKQFDYNIQELNSFKDSINPLNKFIKILMIAFPLTVIYPLHFMPVDMNQNPEWTINPILIYSSILSLKNTMLLIFFVTIEALFLYFLKQTHQLKLKYSKAIINNKIEYRELKSYYPDYCKDNFTNN